MHIVLPAARGLRTVFRLSADPFWFVLLVFGGLFLATELVELILYLNAPPLEVIGF